MNTKQSKNYRLLKLERSYKDIINDIKEIKELLDEITGIKKRVYKNR